MEDDRDRAVDKIIRQAMDEGQFDNLPGRGQPLDLGDPHEDPTRWAAHRLLKNSGFAPDWVEERREIEAELAAARTALARSWVWRVDALAQGKGDALVAEEWNRAQTRFREVVQAVNRRIRAYNLKAPRAEFHLRVVDAEADIAQVRADRGPGR